MATHPIFEECCAKEIDQRRATHLPFYRDGYLYATDGRVCVRMRQDGEDTSGSPNTSTIGWPDDEHKYGREAVALPQVSIPERVICPECKGKKVATCSECNGAGELECPECEHVGLCRDCAGTGKTECDECDAHGKARQTSVETIKLASGYGLADHYVALLNKHGAEAYLPVKLGRNPTYFTVAGGIEGLLMPRTL